MLTAARAVAPKTQETGTSQVPASHTLSLNSSEQEGSNNPNKSQPLKPDRKILGPKTNGEAGKILRCAAIAFTDGDIFKAQKFYLKWMLMRSAWLAKHRKTLPTEAQLEYERYGRPRRKEGANG